MQVQALVGWQELQVLLCHLFTALASITSQFRHLWAAVAEGSPLC